MANGGGFLNSPRVRVLWGDVNLSSYDGNQKFPKNTPVVYNMQVDQSSENEGPTAEMKWDPSAAGASLYEWFVGQDKYMQKQITIEFFYSGGKKITFFFVWSGQSINYGNDMTITVKMQSELSGLVNSNVRNTAQAYDEKKGATAIEIANKSQKQFGLDKYNDLVKYNPVSKAYWDKVKMTTVYGNDWTFGNNLSQIAKQTGDMTFPNNIGKPNISIMPPYSWKDPKGGKQEEILDGSSDIGAGQAPDPSKRYGYILGPSIINSITRSSNWKPPQQSNTNTPGTQVRARDPKTGRFISQKGVSGGQKPAAPQVAQSNQDAAAKKTSSPQGTANGRANLAVQNKDNPYGPDRQNALNDEKGSDLQLDTLMCPLLVGVKPHDILFIPSFTGKFIEDWIVQSVGYNQDDGRVNINIRATRTFGQQQSMNETASKKFKALAESKNLIGPNATLEAWDTYAWSLPPKNQNKTPAANPPIPGFKPARGGDFVDM
jgi:hypothetical protein